MECVYPPVTLSPEDKKNMYAIIVSRRSLLAAPLFFSVDLFPHSQIQTHHRMSATQFSRFE
jgi:hypothetical protein